MDPKVDTDVKQESEKGHSEPKPIIETTIASAQTNQTTTEQEPAKVKEITPIKEPQLEKPLVSEPIQTNVTTAAKVIEEPMQVPSTNTTQTELATGSEQSPASSKQAESQIESEPK